MLRACGIAPMPSQYPIALPKVDSALPILTHMRKALRKVPPQCVKTEGVEVAAAMDHVGYASEGQQWRLIM